MFWLRPLKIVAIIRVRERAVSSKFRNMAPANNSQKNWVNLWRQWVAGQVTSRILVKISSPQALPFSFAYEFFFFFRVCLVAACRWPLHTTLPLDMNVSQRPLDSSCVPIRNGLSLVRNFTIFRSIFQFFKTRKSNRLKRWKRPWRHLGKYWQLWQRCNPALIRLQTKI